MMMLGTRKHPLLLLGFTLVCSSVAAFAPPRTTERIRSALLFAPPSERTVHRCCESSRTVGSLLAAQHRDVDTNVVTSPAKSERADNSSPNGLAVDDNETRPASLPAGVSSILVLSTIFILFTVVAPFAANAIDHPADYASLNLPSSIPGADPRYFISGGLCAAASHGATTPIDVVKTRIQAEPEVYEGRGLWNAAGDIVRQDGVGILATGLGPTVVGYGLEGAVKFGLYESLKPSITNLLATDNPAVPYLIASIVAGAAASLFLCPMERTRIRLVTDPEYADGLVSALPKLAREDGVASLFSGMPAMLSKQIPYTATKQVTFDIFAGMLYAAAASYGLSATSGNIKLEVATGAAFLSSILSCVASHPGDVLLTATYKGSSSSTESSSSMGFPEIVSELYQTKGIGGFFTGISARFVHVGAIITSQLVLYDFIKQMLGLPATGAH